MGYNLHQWDFLQRCMSKYFPNSDGREMLELGNQRIKNLVLRKFSIKNNVAKHYFTNLGFKHTSFDYNGNDGAICIDLSKGMIQKEHFGKYDIITNSGVTEHIEPYESQYECFKNIHLCSKAGSVFLHLIPEVGGFKDHCQYYYNVDFINDLCSLNNYKVLELERFQKQNGTLVMVCLERIDDSDFCKDRERFLKNITKVPYSKKALKKFKKKKSYRYQSLKR